MKPKAVCYSSNKNTLNCLKEDLQKFEIESHDFSKSLKNIDYVFAVLETKSDLKFINNLKNTNTKKILALPI